MAEKVVNYQCPACTGPLRFNGASGRLECEYCGNSYAVEEIEERLAGKQAAAEADGGNEGQAMREYHCPSCGAELICDETTAVGRCPYCGNPSVIPGQFAGAWKPDYIIPFKLEKEAAVAALNKFYKKKFLLPRNFTERNHIEKITGVYVPFWLFEAKAAGEATYQATRTMKTREGDYMVTRTSHYIVKREGSARFKNIPADASAQMSDPYMDSIEPFEYREITDFSSAYMPGYLANKYDVSAEECALRAELRCENSLAELLRRDVKGYHTVVETGRNIHVQRGSVKYAFFPVWVLSTRWKEKNYLFMMNGQTGKLVGDLPVSKGKFAALFLGLAVGLTLLFGLCGLGDALASLILL